MIDRIRRESGVDAVLLAGDLTDDGGKKRACCMRIPSSAEHFEHGFLHSLELNVAPAFLCAGNHDIRPRGESPVVDLIVDRYHDTVYSFDIGDVHFVCCHLYPDSTRLQRLISDLDKLMPICAPVAITDPAIADTGGVDDDDAGDLEPADPTAPDDPVDASGPVAADDPVDADDPVASSPVAAGATVPHPVVIFFHYNITGPHSDWWSAGGKEAFYEVIKPTPKKGYRVCCVAVGHQHRSYIEKWRDVSVVSGAGGSDCV